MFCNLFRNHDHDHDHDPDPDPGANRAAGERRLTHWIRLRVTMLVLRLDRLATVVFASAASFIGVDALLGILGLTASFPVAIPVVIVALTLLTFVRSLLARVWRLVRGRAARRRSSADA